MILTGKCKEDFEKWHREQTPEMGHWYSIVNFNNLPNSMKYGVYVDFFDSVGLYIDDWGETTRWEWAIHKIPNNWWDAEHSVITRQEARTKAIEKANEIYNNN